MDDTVQNDAHPRPSDRTIAFAVSVVLSKPEELTVRDEEYIQLLRQHVAKGRRENAISSVYRHLDGSSYWRSEYERVKDAMKAAEGENADLKRQMEDLRTSIESSKSISPAKKRKKPNEDVVPVPRSPKQPKHERSPTKSASAATEAFADLNIAELGEAGNILMRRLYQVHSLLQSHNKTEAPVLAQQLMGAAAALPQVIQRAVQRHNSTPNADDNALKTVLTAAGSSFLLLITAFSRLSHVTDGPTVQGHVTYALVQMYSRLVDCFRELSLLEARKTMKVESSTSCHTKQSLSKAKGKHAKTIGIKDNTPLSMMTSFMSSAVDGLDPKVDTHKALFEGLAYVVISELGSRLYKLVFGHDRGATIEQEITTSGQPDDIEDGPELASDLSEDIDQKAARLAAPYLVHLLNLVMRAAPSYLGANAPSKTSKSKQASNKGATKGALAIAAKERLQRTLVNCIFGSEGLDDNDPFVDCLKMPIVDGPALFMPKVKEAEVQEWFQEEVWRLLGWDILSREGDW
ncbi:hypothetical protein LTR37_003117 [Vermiconidia calcicola]|uniref:Uncharacterized protein n=1 Tax=Vermiconidia calcicola TaxID=1690605 RepID=A0ACC3NRN1_9PEZI|nr:hypothetical protein LTR37_003117 [Vermiconidia calcicola]